MNSKQTLVVVIFASLLAGVIAFPPFQTKGLGLVRNDGHHFLLNPPHRLSRVDAGAVALRAGLVVAAGVALCFALKEKR